MSKGHAGIEGKLEVSTSQITTKGDGTEVGRVTSASITHSHSTLDISSLDEEGIYNIQGLQDGEASMELYEAPEESSHQMIETAFNQGNPLYIAYWPSSTPLGVTGQFIVTTSDHTSEVDSADTHSVSAMLTSGDGFTILT
jgi:hypothetical protein